MQIASKVLIDLHAFQRKTNDSKEKDIDFAQLECSQMVKENIAFVEINFGQDTYVRTVSDKRMTFSDQLSSIGNTNMS